MSILKLSLGRPPRTPLNRYCDSDFYSRLRTESNVCIVAHSRNRHCNLSGCLIAMFSVIRKLPPSLSSAVFIAWTTSELSIFIGAFYCFLPRHLAQFVWVPGHKGLVINISDISLVMASLRSLLPPVIQPNPHRALLNCVVLIFLKQ